ncbi:hypothetical protein ABEB36_006021 [Hypothenemus hampei]|uniref:Cuticle protein n=1 Tax=Hypothenemus hampei TaxID=57062 RepID=A0ABD1F090_HYPHA
MSLRFVVFVALLAYARAGVVPAAPLAYAAAPAHYAYAAPVAKAVVAGPAPLAYAAPVAKAVVAAHAEEYDPNPQYSYGYEVQDGLTGDNKYQQETRNGDVVEGSYSLVEPDGNRRTVDYSADPVNGFNAVVRREPAAVAVKAVAAAPAIAKVATPIAYSAAPAPLTRFAIPRVPATPLALAPRVAYAAQAAPIAYSAPAAPLARVTYSSPIASYHL